MIQAHDISVRFGEVVALPATTLALAPGERLGVRGPNGSGKSTLLRVLAGLQPLSAGRIEGLLPGGRCVLVHQRPHLFRGTPRSNVAYALRLAGRPASDALGWLERLGAGHLADRSVAGLSGGERRRVALARALARDPEVLLLDEPFAGLDEPGRIAVSAACEAFQGTLVIAAPDLDHAPLTRLQDLNPQPVPAGIAAQQSVVGARLADVPPRGDSTVTGS